ncbi:Uncharacterised protein [Zhongshania aliphaticivorans]|uniref:Uncharacterized protein n=1 Tax=Zhongshania aliphaticivorans TaxID=1470434 RepID=A0A5S9N5K5_9GAMM|nr:hypothetical protein [Zhongshania aliphaticivorans]CAA0081208.1 Uncharacterised protein [Zhongshania aliphaticivorans]CAA0085053.1 Uncharacterised protein [Zhongshania aliphaticivorans]
MSTFPFFTPPVFSLDSWHTLYTLILVITAAISFIGLRNNRGDINHYLPSNAWRRAIIYFCVCSLLSVFTGVTDALLLRPVASTENINDPLWLCSFLVCTGFIIFAYGYIWARGTYTAGRPWHPVSCSLFGIMWGLSQGQLFLSFWALCEIFNMSLLLTALLTAVTISIYNGLWQQHYWDHYVSPDHNIAEWNLRKVLLCHVPNLILTLSFLSVYGNIQLYLFLQTTALLISSHRMHFPHWADRSVSLSKT